MGNFAILLNNAFTSVASNATSFANNSLMGVESFIDTGKTVFEDFFAQAFTFIWSLITNFLYFICKFILNLLDFLFVIVQELAGQNTGSILNSPTIGDASTKDILLRFLFSPTTISVLKALFILSIVLLIIFTIIALIKTEYSSVVNDADNSKMPVFRNVLKSLFLMLFVPIIAIGGIIVSNSVLSSIARAMNATDNTSISTQVFMASAYQSNRFRSYANNNKKIPILFNFRELDEGDNIVETPGGDTVKELEANMKRFLESSTAYDLGAQTFNMFSSGGFFNMSDISADSLYYNLYDNKNDIELTTYRDEYFVMADVVDFVMRTGMQLYIVNAERVLINSGNNAFNISYEGKNIEYKWNNTHDEADGAKYLICYKEPNDKLGYDYIPLRNDLNGFHTEFSEPNSYVLARGLFSSEGYPTAIYDENNKVGFYRDINSVPMLYDMLPVISYEPRPDMELTLGYKAMNFLTKEITGLKLSDFVPYVYYRFDVFSLFTKKVNVILEIDNGELLFDYNFASGVPMTNLYNTSDINFLIMILALALLFGVLMKAMWGFIGRIFDILMLYLAFPAIASTYPLDDGERVGNWVTAFIKKLFMAYGFVIILNVIFILSGVIFNIKFISSSDLSGAAQLIRNFGIHDYVNATYTLAGSLNFLIQTMFLLVLFSLLQGGKSKSGTSMINDLIGSEDLLAKGKALQGNTKAVYNKGMSFVSGQAIKNSASKLIGQKDETGQRRGGLVNSMPGISVIKSVADKRKFGNTMEENRIIEKELKSSFGNRNQPASKLGIIEGADKMEKSNKNVGDLSKKYSKRAEMSKSNIKAMNDEKKAKAKKKKDETDFLEKKNKVSNKNNDWKKEKKLREEYNRNLGNSNYAGVANNAMAGANDPTNANTTANEVATPSDKPSPK